MLELGGSFTTGDLIVIWVWFLIFIAPIFLMAVLADSLNPQKLTFYVCFGLVAGTMLCFFSVPAGVLEFVVVTSLGVIMLRLQRLEAKIEARNSERKE